MVNFTSKKGHNGGRTRRSRRQCQLLLEHGADPTVRTNKGWTALHLAALNAHTSVCRMLLSHGVGERNHRHRSNAPGHRRKQGPPRTGGTATETVVWTAVVGIADVR